MHSLLDKISKKGKRRTFLHLIYWVGVVLFFGFFWGTDFGHYTKHFFSEIILLPVKMAVVYTFLYYIIPRLLFREKYTWFLLTSLVVMITGGVLLRMINIHIIFPIYPPEKSLQYFNIYEIMHRVIDINTLLIIPATAKILITWYENKQKAESLKREKLKAELKFLKSQVHPHFLFNTLNNLYSLIEKKDEKAGDVVIRLSGLMRYMLKETPNDFIPLEKELEMLRDYIELERIRFGSEAEISFSVNGDPAGKEIAVLTFLPFVENAFKHGLTFGTEGGWITINLLIKEEHLVMNIENSICRETEQGTGFGLTNAEQRFKRLYGENYKLNINKEDDLFSIRLQIDFNKNQLIESAA